MKKIISQIILTELTSFLLIIIITISYNAVYTSAATIEKDGLMTNISNFLNTIESIDTSVSIGNEIPTYSLQSNIVEISKVQYYPLLENGYIVGLISNYNNNNMTYTAAYNDVLNNFLKDNKKIALIGNIDSFMVISDKSSSILFGESFEYNSNKIYYTSLNKIYDVEVDKPNITNTTISSYLSYPYAYGLSIPSKKQQTKYNCWAASVACVGQYKTSINFDSNYVSSYLNNPYGGSPQDVWNGLVRIYTLDSYYSTGPFYFNQLMADINSLKPVIAFYSYQSYSHVVVLSGYGSSSSSASYAYMDPTDGAMHNATIGQDGYFTITSGTNVLTLSYYFHLWWFNEKEIYTDYSINYIYNIYFNLFFV